VLIPENGHEKGGLLPNQETGIRSLFLRFWGALRASENSLALDRLLEREAREAKPPLG